MSTGDPGDLKRPTNDDVHPASMVAAAPAPAPAPAATTSPDSLILDNWITHASGAGATPTGNLLRLGRLENFTTQDWEELLYANLNGRTANGTTVFNLSDLIKCYPATTFPLQSAFFMDIITKMTEIQTHRFHPPALPLVPCEFDTKNPGRVAADNPWHTLTRSLPLKPSTPHIPRHLADVQQRISDFMETPANDRKRKDIDLYMALGETPWRQHKRAQTVRRPDDETVQWLGDDVSLGSVFQFLYLNHRSSFSIFIQMVNAYPGTFDLKSVQYGPAHMHHLAMFRPEMHKIAQQTVEDKQFKDQHGSLVLVAEISGAQYIEGARTQPGLERYDDHWKIVQQKYNRNWHIHQLQAICQQTLILPHYDKTNVAPAPSPCAQFHRATQLQTLLPSRINLPAGLVAAIVGRRSTFVPVAPVTAPVASAGAGAAAPMVVVVDDDNDITMLAAATTEEEQKRILDRQRERRQIQEIRFQSPEHQALSRDAGNRQHFRCMTCTVDGHWHPEREVSSCQSCGIRLCKKCWSLAFFKRQSAAIGFAKSTSLSHINVVTSGMDDLFVKTY
jgi:hypothetical protein